MVNQRNGEDHNEDRGEAGKVKQDVEEAMQLPTKKRASDDCLQNDVVDGERKRVRILELADGNVLQNNVEPSSVESDLGQLVGTNVLSDQSVECKQITLAATTVGTQEKAARHKIMTRLRADVAEDRGSRHTMEDASLLLPQAWLETPGKLRFAHFAIYDGHGGRHAADYACAHLHANVVSAGLPRESMDIKRVKRAISEGFKRTDEAILQESIAGRWQDGATAVCVWVLGQMVFVANVGDAKAVLARVPPKSGGDAVKNSNLGSNVVQEAPLKSLVVTREHKAIFTPERARIEKAGGFVEGNGRLLGRLEVSRAFGDRNFKKAGVISVPDIQVFELTERERFLILGCDGLWGVFGPGDAVEFVDRQLKDGVTTGIACRRLIREAVRERKCKDNCTAVVINFEHLQL